MPDLTILVLRVSRHTDGALARESGVTKTMKRKRKWGWISNTGGRRLRSTPYFEYKIVR
jgi:hypothetical protein